MLKMLRRALLVSVTGALVGGVYIATPFYTAWTIREAIKAGDSRYLEAKIEWDTVRSTLKESLGKFAFSSSGDLAETPEKLSLWQRIKTYVGRGAVERFVETTVTPTGMSGLLEVRKAYRSAVSTAEPPQPVWVRASHVWSRVVRAEFMSLDRFELDMIDKNAPERTFAAVLERRGFEWKMTELRVKSTEPGKLTATAVRAAL